MKEVKLSLHIQVDRGEEIRLEQFLGGKFLAVYYAGMSDGLQKAREIAFPLTPSKEEKSRVKEALDQLKAEGFK